MDLLENNKDDRPLNAVLMGMDVGKKTIGISLSDAGQSIATPLCTITRKKFRQDLAEIERLSHEYNVRGFVLGYPLNMDGSVGPRCQSIRDFAFEFKAQLSDEFKSNGDVWISLWDERLSTASVENFVDETVGISKRKAKERGILDKLAAQVILQGALDYIART